MSWANGEFIVFDLEANADRSDPPAHEIIEIGAVLVCDGVEVDTFETLVRRMAWNPPGMTARGRTTILDVNYRNTREILDLGRELLVGLGRKPDSHQPDDLDVLVEPDRAVRTGLPPLSLHCSDLRGEAEAIAKRVRELRVAGASPDQIAVLLGTEDLRHDVVRLVPDAFDTKAGRNRIRIFEAGWRLWDCSRASSSAM